MRYYNNGSPINIDWDIFREHVAIVEYNNDVDLEINLEVEMLLGSAGVNLREEHVSRNFNIVDTVSIRHLNVLHLCR